MIHRKGTETRSIIFHCALASVRQKKRFCIFYYSPAREILRYIYSMKQVLLFILILTSSLPLARAQSLFKTMTFGDTTRTYRIYIPALYDSSQPVPLVMALHGLGDNANNFQGVGFNHIANAENFIVAYPNALTDPLLGATGWSAGMNPLNAIDDVGFLNALIDTIQSEYSIDTNRIYACGFSMGGFMTHKLACESGERLAAIASVAGTLPATSVAICTPSRAMPVLHIHGTSDQTIPYDYGVIFFVVTNLGADSTTHYWELHNACNAAAQHDSFPDTESDGLTFEKFSYSGCADSSEVILIKANGMSHTWPYSPANDIDATEEIWNFFSRHRKVIPEDTTGTSVSVAENVFSISPNPASKSISIQTNFTGKTEVMLRNVEGKEVFRHHFTGNTFSMELRDFAAGIYLLTLVNGNTTFTEKLVIRH